MAYLNIKTRLKFLQKSFKLLLGITHFMSLTSVRFIKFLAFCRVVQPLKTSDEC
jgi:hypothetical protein